MFPHILQADLAESVCVCVFVCFYEFVSRLAIILCNALVTYNTCRTIYNKLAYGTMFFKLMLLCKTSTRYYIMPHIIEVYLVVTNSRKDTLFFFLTIHSTNVSCLNFVFFSNNKIPLFLKKILIFISYYFSLHPGHTLNIILYAP